MKEKRKCLEAESSMAFWEAAVWSYAGSYVYQPQPTVQLKRVMLQSHHCDHVLAQRFVDRSFFFIKLTYPKY